MRLSPVRFTLRWMMVAVAIVGLNLAAAISTSRCYPRPRPPSPVMVGNGRGYVSYMSEGQVEYGVGNAETGYRRTRVELLRPRPTLLRIWSPVIASVVASILVLTVATKPWAWASDPSATGEV
jgi:hypothetical protein